MYHLYDGGCIMTLHEIEASSLSFLLQQVGKAVAASTPDTNHTVCIDMLDAIRMRFQPWNISREEAAVVATVWTAENSSSGDIYDMPDRTARDILFQTFGEEAAFDRTRIIRRLETLGILELSTDAMSSSQLSHAMRTTNRTACYRHLYRMSAAFHVVVELLNDGVAFASLRPVGRTMPDIASTVTLDEMGGLRIDADRTTHHVRVSEVSKPTRYLTLLENAGGLDAHILNADVEVHLRGVVSALQTGTGTTLASWGVIAASATRGNSILLHGPAGTGKTSGARAIAGALQAQLYTTSVERIHARYVGESESNLVKMFSEFRAIAQEASTPPVLLIDECEYLFGRRVTAIDSVDASFNNLVGIALKELETLPGIVVGTTNLIDNLDPAFSRRFDYKILVDRPDKEAQRRLWEMYLKPTIPGATSVNVHALVRVGDFTGAIIERIVLNTCTRIVNDSTREQRLFTEDLLAACYQEQRSTFDGSARGFMGFM